MELLPESEVSTARPVWTEVRSAILQLFYGKGHISSRLTATLLDFDKVNEKYQDFK